MRTLFIDTHLFDINIILFDNNKVVDRIQVTGLKHNSEHLLPSIKKVCDKHDYNQIIVVNGPGSFTGVRLGVTVAKTLAYTQQKNIIPVSYFDLMALSQDCGKHIYAICDNNGYFIGEYCNQIKIKEFYYLNNTDFKKFAVDNMVETNVAIDYDKIIPDLIRRQPINPHAVNPIYIKTIGVENDTRN